MKRCPACNRVETDEALIFCRTDGARLAYESASTGEAPTAAFGSHLSSTRIWLQPIHGGEPRQLTDFKTDLIFSFDFSRDGKWIVLSRGTEQRDAILINFR